MKERKVQAKVAMLSMLILSAVFTGIALQTKIAAASPTTVFQDGFESGGLSGWDGGGLAAVVRSPVHAGSYAARATGPTRTTGTADGHSRRIVIVGKTVESHTPVSVIMGVCCFSVIGTQINADSRRLV